MIRVLMYCHQGELRTTVPTEQPKPYSGIVRRGRTSRSDGSFCRDSGNELEPTALLTATHTTCDTRLVLPTSVRHRRIAEEKLTR